MPMVVGSSLLSVPSSVDAEQVILSLDGSRNLNITSPSGSLLLQSALGLLADPTTPLGAATKQYVDNALGGKLSLTGGTVSGATTFSAAVTMSAGGTIGGTFGGAATFSGGLTLNGAVTSAAGLTVTGGGALAANFTNIGRGNTYSLTGSTIDTTKLGLFVNNNISGSSTASEIPAAGYFSIASANVAAPSTLIDGVNVVMVTGGAAAASAGWNGLAVSLNDGASATNDLAGGGAGAFVAAQINRRASKNQGGTALTTAGAFGQHWGIDIVNILQSGATFQALQNGLEINQSVASGASVVRRAGLQISSPATHVARAALWDNGIFFGCAASAATPLAGIMFGQQISGTSPLGTDSTMMAHKFALDRTATAGIGFDMRDVTYTTDFIRGPGNFGVGPTGIQRHGSFYITPTAAGVELDAKGSVGTGTPTINAGGSGWASSDVADDAFGGVYIITATSGAITSVVVKAQPEYPTTSPPATLTLTARAPSTGTGGVLNGSWSSNRTTLSLNPGGGAIKVGSGAMTANGTTSVSLTALAPAGAHATVQEWLTITDNGGTVRYIPCF